MHAARTNERWGHVARLLLIGVYTGTRPGAILGLKWMPSATSGWFDLEAGVLHRRGSGSGPEGNKRQPPARIHTRLLPHLRRWREDDLAEGIASVIHYRGEPILKLRRSWSGVARAAGSKRRDSPHIVRHTAATWQMQAGTELAQAAAYLGMRPETLWDYYGHHHPDFQQQAANAQARRIKPRTYPDTIRNEMDVGGSGWSSATIKVKKT